LAEERFETLYRTIFPFLDRARVVDFILRRAPSAPLEIRDFSRAAPVERFGVAPRRTFRV
jgi:hypothetical protein